MFQQFVLKDADDEEKEVAIWLIVERKCRVTVECDNILLDETTD